MTNITYIIPHAQIGDSPLGGAQMHLLLLLQHINRENFTCRVITGGGDEFVQRINALQWQTVVIPEIVRSIDPIKSFIAIKKTAGTLKSYPTDIVHTHTSMGGAVGRIAARLAGVQHIVHTVHGFGFHDFSHPVKKNIFIQLERFLGRITDKIICVSPENLQRTLALRIAPQEKTLSIPNGIDLSRFNTEKIGSVLFEKFNLQADAIVIGMIGRLDEQKDPETFINAAIYILKEFPEVKFILIGDGPHREKLERTARALKIEKSIIFAGWQPNVPSLLSGIKIFVLPSLWEGMPLTLIEAMAAAKPVVATDIIGNREVVVNGETGFLVPTHSPESLASAVIRLLKNPGMMAQMGRAGRKRATENHDVCLMVKKTEMIYKSLIPV
ncbi:MAG: glycosyltransferase family 4 protein [bacterium]